MQQQDVARVLSDPLAQELMQSSIPARYTGRPPTREIDERTNSLGPAGVMAMACRQRRPDATREAPAVIPNKDQLTARER
jgi:hypothetical protein